MMLELVSHPDFPPNLVTRVGVQIEWDQEGAIWLEYCVHGAKALALPPRTTPRRAEELWNTTCFELFCTKPDLVGYYEFNFSPSFEWAAYAFDGYRAGRKDLPAENPEIEISPADEFFFLAAEPWPSDLIRGADKLAPTAIIEETDGTKSYWALKHPPGAPDFHHPDCFALRLPAPDEA